MAMNYTPVPDDFLEEMEELTDEEYGRLIRALQRYRMTGEMPSLPGNEVYCAKRGKMQIDRYVENYNKKVKAKSNAGRAGANKRWQNQIAENSSAISAMAEDSNAITEDSKNGKTKTKTKTNTNTKVISSPKGSDITDTPLSPLTGGGVAVTGEIVAEKPKKKAKNQTPKVQWAEFVTMTNDEHDKLLATYGPADTARMIEILDNYKGSSGKKYASDYRACLNWVADRVKEENAKKAKSTNIFYEIGKEEGLF